MTSAQILLIGSLAALSVPPGFFSNNGENVDNFIIRTTQRISQSWEFARTEFQMASSSAVQETKESVREEVSRQADAAVRHLQDKAMEQLKRNTVPPAPPPSQEKKD